MKVCCRCGSLCSEQGHSSSSSINTWDYLGLTLILRRFDTYHSGSTVLGSSRFNFEHACCEVFGIAQIPVVSILGTSPRLRASSFCRLIFFSSWLARPTWCRAMSPKGTLFSQQNVFIFVCKGPKGTQCLINCLIFCDSDIIIIIILFLLLVVVVLLLLWLLLLLYIYYLFMVWSFFWCSQSCTKPSDHRLLRVVLLFLDLVDIPKFVGVPAQSIYWCHRPSGSGNRVSSLRCLYNLNHNTTMSHRVRCRGRYFFQMEVF